MKTQDVNNENYSLLLNDHYLFCIDQAKNIIGYIENAGFISTFNDWEPSKTYRKKGEKKLFFALKDVLIILNDEILPKGVSVVFESKDNKPDCSKIALVKNTDFDEIYQEM